MGMVCGMCGGDRKCTEILNGTPQGHKPFGTSRCTGNNNIHFTEIKLNWLRRGISEHSAM